jgi:hypothetical protein
MTVFIVTVKAWDDTEGQADRVETVGVFSTRERAEAFVSALDKVDRINSEITSFVVV